jgi:hypothetical protein
MDMCANGSGNSAAGAHCMEGVACSDIGGRWGAYGWCHTEEPKEGRAHKWGGCTPCAKVTPIKVYLLLDGVPVPRAQRGKDVVEDAFGRTDVDVFEPRIYFLISE